jgi:hypothetical protein
VLLKSVQLRNSIAGVNVRSLYRTTQNGKDRSKEGNDVLDRRCNRSTDHRPSSTTTTAAVEPSGDATLLRNSQLPIHNQEVGMAR